MKSFLLILQILLSVSLVVLILLQSKGTGLGSAFGGSSQTYSTKRGVEKVVFYFTIGLAILFFVSSLLQLFTFKQ